MRVATGEEMRSYDRETIEKVGLPGVVLMENAGRAVVAEVMRRLGEGRGRIATVLCGPGNNGGDGFVVARVLADRGFVPHVYLAGPFDKVKDDARVHLDALRRCGVDVRTIPESGHFIPIRKSIGRSAVVVDALLGTGAAEAPRGPISLAVEAFNFARGLRIAVDLPTGVGTDTGHVAGIACRADVTVTLGLPKLGLLLEPGARFAGEIVVADIGIPGTVIDASPPACEWLDAGALAAFRGRRDPESHKGTYGHLLIVAGSPGKAGAGLIAARAALRSGAGLVTLATDGEARARIEGRLPEVMVEAIRGGQSEAQRITRLCEDKDALAVGPGMGTGAQEGDLLSRLLGAHAGPLVLDADALTLLGQKHDLFEKLMSRALLTPHPGEMARLLGKTTGEVQLDRVGLARAFAKERGVVVLLKGHRTIVAAPDGRWAINTTGNPGLATAGSGDALTGLLGALLAQGCSLFDAARLGAWAHGTAADRAVKRTGERGLLAGDVVEALGAVWRELEGAVASDEVAVDEDG